MLEFSLAQETRLETAGAIAVQVVADLASQEPIEIAWTVAGTAHEGTHYELNGDSVKLLPPATSTTIELLLLPGLMLFEGDVELALRLQEPSNAELGQRREYRLQIQNDDLFGEIEPNNDVASANSVGVPLTAEKYGKIVGGVGGPVSADAFDVFSVEAAEACSLALEITPTVPADVSLWISDSSGALTELFESGGPGQAEGGTLDLAPGERVFLIALSLDLPTGYALTAESAGFIVIEGATDSARDPLLDFGNDWEAVARAWIRRKNPGNPPEFTPATLLDCQSGRCFMSWLHPGDRLPAARR